VWLFWILIMKIFAFILSITASTILLAGEKPYAPESMPGTTTVSAEEAIEMILANPELIVIDKNTPLLFYCNGVRCLRSSDSLTKAVGWGYTNLFWFRGGWKEWTEKRLPMVTD